MTDEHKREIVGVLERARLAPTLLEALEIIFTAHCCEEGPQIRSAFVVDLFAEAGRNPAIATLVRSVLETLQNGVTELVAQAPEFHGMPHGLRPEQISELIFAAARGMMMRDVLDGGNRDDADRRDREITVVRNLWCLLFNHANEPASA